MKVVNCWDINKCGKENECPAYPNHGYDCWNITGTLCCADSRATYADKVGHCREACIFYHKVILGTVKVAS
jgi:hypothetical protein